MEILNGVIETIFRLFDKSVVMLSYMYLRGFGKPLYPSVGISMSVGW